MPGTMSFVGSGNIVDFAVIDTLQLLLAFAWKINTLPWSSDGIIMIPLTTDLIGETPCGPDVVAVPPPDPTETETGTETECECPPAEPADHDGAECPDEV